MKLNSNMAARERNHAIQPGRTGSPLSDAEGDKMPALPANARRRARSDAPFLLAAGKPELREYKWVYVQKYEEIGLFSDEVVVNCAQ